MAAEDDLISQLIFETPTSPAVAQFNSLLDANRRQLEYVQAAMVSINAPTAAYQARLNDLIQTDARLTAEVDRLSAAESAHVRVMLEDEAAARQSFVTYQMFTKGGSQFKAGMDQAGEGTQRFSRGLLQLGYIADDAQYGLRGIQNNIPQLAFLLGGASGMALAGASGIAMTAVALLINHWQQLSDVFGLGATQTEAERMKSLADATARTIDETVKLAEYQRQQKAGEEILTGLPKAKREEAQKVKEALDEAGGADVIKGFARLQAEQAGGRDAMIQQAEAERSRRLQRKGFFEALISGESYGESWQAIKRNIGLETREQQVAERAKQLQITHEQAAQRDLARAETDPTWRNKMVAEIRAHPEYFPPGALGKLEAVSPEKLAAEQAAKAEKKQDTVEAKVQAALQKTERQATQEAGRQGRIDLKSEPIRQFLAGTLPLEGLGEREATTIRGGTRTILGREAAGTADPKLLKAIEDQTKLMEVEARRPMAPPRPVAGARRALGVGG
jgi:hypothetical protein